MSDDLPERPLQQQRPGARLSMLPLDGLGVAELETYISDLQAEITRAELMIGRKKAHLGAADLVFGRPPDRGAA